jgi:hypothetical protein
VAESTGSNCEKYTSKAQIIMQVIPFKKIFSAAVGGNQKLTSTIKTMTTAGVTTIVLNIGDLR